MTSARLDGIDPECTLTCCDVGEFEQRQIHGADVEEQTQEHHAHEEQPQEEERAAQDAHERTLAVIVVVVRATRQIQAANDGEKVLVILKKSL